MTEQAHTRLPAVSVILPTFNRAGFLPQAFESIRQQNFTDLELIVVDDGSTDGTAEVVARLGGDLARPIRYVYQENQGPYPARNQGLDLARGRYVAFFDSDDYWLPHHLGDCVEALEAHTEVDWVYGACRMVDLTTGKTLVPNTFYTGGRPQSFLGMRTRTAGRLRIVEDPRATECAIAHGYYNGLQNSVLRRRLFEGRRFAVAYRNEAEDQLIAIRVLAAGHRLAYLDNVHVIYHVHGDNSSASAVNLSLEKQLSIYRAAIRGFEDLRREVRLTPAETRALDRRLAREYFWHLGYALLWQHGRKGGALEAFRRGLRLWPWNPWYWKTYLLARGKTLLGNSCKPRLSQSNLFKEP